MQIKAFSDYDAMSQAACDAVVDILNQTPDALISFAAGNTPLEMVRCFVNAVNQKKVDIRTASYVSLDEWVGLGAEDVGSCARFNEENLFSRLQDAQFAHQYLIDGLADDLAAECQRIDTFIDAHGPLTVSVLGIGMNGHLGFNEDGVDFSLNAHVTPLSATTKGVMSKYFDRERPLEQGITQGIAQIMKADTVILLANGEAKADILARALQGPVSNDVPASILQNHPRCIVLADHAALKNIAQS